tara:strand:- start:687 stop:983 length:297 start_codon:yes stop_codon:yes gene_type:complete
MTNHTPGPWYVDEGANGDVLITATHLGPDYPTDDVCHVYGGNNVDKEQALADAYAIAALPDLLAALQSLLVAFDSDFHDLVLAKMKAQAAIAKAKGGE